MRVGRIASAAHAAFDGEGARRHSRRWTPQGIPAVFTWATLSLAALERFVHTDSNIEPTDLLAIPVEIRDDIGINAVDLEALPTGWRAFPAPPALRRLASSGSEHPAHRSSQYPSVVIPHPVRKIIVGAQVSLDGVMQAPASIHRSGC